MKPRVSNVIEAIRERSSEIKAKLGLGDFSLQETLDPVEVIDKVEYYIRNEGMVVAVSREKVLDGIGKGKVLEGAQFHRNPNVVSLADGVLKVRYELRGFEKGTSLYEYSEAEVKGKPTRVLSKILGAKGVAHYLNKKGNPFQPIEAEILLTDKYFPEVYFQLKEDQDISSCMSHESSWYDLPDDEHPLLAYEGTRNALLAVVVSGDKLLGRAVCRVLEPEEYEQHEFSRLAYSRVYGAGNAARVLAKCPWTTTQFSVEGIELQKIESSRDGLLCPYIDGLEGVYERSDCLVGTDDEETTWNYETGRISARNWCELYEEYVEEDVYIEVLDYRRSTLMACESAVENYACWSDYEDMYIHEFYTVRSEYHSTYLYEPDSVYVDFLDDYVSEDVTLVCVESNNSSFDVPEDRVDDVIYYMKDDGVDYIEVDGEIVYKREEEEEDAA